MTNFLTRLWPYAIGVWLAVICCAFVALFAGSAGAQGQSNVPPWSVAEDDAFLSRRSLVDDVVVSLPAVAEVDPAWGPMSTWYKTAAGDWQLVGPTPKMKNETTREQAQRHARSVEASKEVTGVSPINPGETPFGRHPNPGALVFSPAGLLSGWYSANEYNRVGPTPLMEDDVPLAQAQRHQSSVQAMCLVGFWPKKLGV